MNSPHGRAWALNCTVKLRPSRCTLKVILPSLVLALRQAEESVLRPTVQQFRGPDRGRFMNDPG
jgi:hypothetical protein